MDIVELGSTPVSDSSPAGQDCLYEPEYEALSAEINKQNSLDGSTKVDWGKVSKLAQLILEKKSKNLNVAVYLFYAELEVNGFASLPKTTAFFSNFLSNFWDNMFPPKKRMTGRRNTIEWWGDKMAQYVKSAKESYLSELDSTAVLNNFSDIDRFFEDNLPDSAPLAPTINALGQKIVAPKEEEPEPQPEPEEKTDSFEKGAVSEAPRSKEQPAKESAAQVSKDMKPETVIRKTIELVDNRFSALLKRGYLDPAIFKIARLRAWGDVETLPVNESFVTMITAPDNQVGTTIESLMAEKRFQDALWESESYLNQSPLWFDLQWYSYECLKALNREDIAKAVLMETSYFTERVDGILRLKFGDMTPFASSKTIAWIGSSTSSGHQMTAGNTESFKELDKINELIKTKSSEESFQAMLGVLHGSDNIRLKLRVYLLMLEQLQFLKNDKVLEIYAHEALVVIEEYRADRWDQGIVEKIYEFLLTSSLVEKEDSMVDIKEISSKYSILNPLNAIKMKI